MLKIIEWKKYALKTKKNLKICIYMQNKILNLSLS